VKKRREEKRRKEREVLGEEAKKTHLLFPLFR
jgi:hypothetical protein